ncbi:MAG: TIGR02281 family clan AA aspartic protease [Caulobacter sp.]
MQPDRNPWSPKPDEPPPGGGNRLGRWALLIMAVVGIVLTLAKAFPEAVQTGQDWAYVGYGVGLVALVSTALLRVRRENIGLYLRYAAIWSGIIAVLVLGYAYRDEIRGVPERLKTTFNVGTPVQVSKREMVVPQDETGAYVIVGRVNGQRVRFLVDTGATHTVLSPDDARRLGVDTDRLDYVYEAETANGVGYGAAWRAASIEVGAVKAADFDMTINKTPMRASLLGLSFLSRFDSIEFRGRQLILKWSETSAD